MPPLPHESFPTPLKPEESVCFDPKVCTVPKRRLGTFSPGAVPVPVVDGAAGGEAPYDAVPLLLVHAAQTRGVAHTVTKVAEPEQTLDGVEVVGGILEIAGVLLSVACR